MKNSQNRKKKKLDLTVETFPGFLDHFLEWKNRIFQELSSIFHAMQIKKFPIKKPDSWTWKENRLDHNFLIKYNQLLQPILKKYRLKQITKSEKSKFWLAYSTNAQLKSAIDNTLRINGYPVNALDKLALRNTYQLLYSLLFFRIGIDTCVISLSKYPSLRILTSGNRNKSNTIKNLVMTLSEILNNEFPHIFSEEYLSLLKQVPLNKNSKIVADIIYQLSKYNFSKIKHNIFDQIYQNTLTSEAKKALGLYYTPKPIVDFMLNQLNSNFSRNSFLDPACGAGIFLYEYFTLISKENNSEDTEIDQINRLEKIFGYDIDPFALELTALNLFLCNVVRKTTIVNFRVMSHLNLKNINALNIPREPTSYGAKNLPQFDLIISNPPYFVINTNEPPYRDILNTSFYDAVKSDNINIATLFLFKFLRQLSPNGELMFVFPRSFLHVESFAKIRKFILTQYQIVSIFDLGKAFTDVGLQQIILHISQKRSDYQTIHYGYLEMKNHDLQEIIQYEIDPTQYDPSSFQIPLFNGKKPQFRISTNDIISKIQSKNPQFLKKFTRKIQRGLGVQRYASHHRQSAEDLIILGGRSIFNFGIKKSEQIKRYINRNHIIKNNMPASHENNAYYPKIMLQNLVSSKIRIVGTYTEKVQVQYEHPSPKAIYLLSLDTITNIYLKPEFQSYAKVILAILVSEFGQFYLTDVIFLRQTLTLHLDAPYLNQIPIILPSESLKAQIVEIVEKLEDLANQLQEQYPVTSRSIPTWEKPNHPAHKQYQKLFHSLNSKVYELYGLTSQERSYIKNQIREFQEYY